MRDPALRLAFGLGWESPELPLPELPCLRMNDTRPTTKILVKRESASCWPAVTNGVSDSPWLYMAPGELRLAAEGVAQFRVSHGECIAFDPWHDGVGQQEIRSYLLGSVAGAVMIQRGMLVLHGNALARNGEAIVCLGDSGMGKSTLAYALMCQGWELLADDLVAITPELHVLPGIPRIKLWADAAIAFGLDPAALTPILKGVPKYQISGDAIHYSPSTVPLKVIYSLPDVRPEARHPGKSFSFTPVASEREAVGILVGKTYRPHYVQGLGQESANFLAHARLQQRVQLIRLGVPRCLNTLKEILSKTCLLNPAFTKTIAA